MRRDVKESIKHWEEAGGPELILNNVGPVINEANPEARTEMLNWIL